MVVYLARTSSNEHSADVYEKWSEIVQTDIVRSHSVTDNPEKADLVLIVDVASDTDPLSWRLRTHPIWKKGYKNILAYDERDWPRDPLAGLVVSLPQSLHQAAIHRAAPYFRTVQNFQQPLGGQPDLLFSFIGATSHPLRERIFALSHPRGMVLRSGVNYFDETPSAEVIQKQEEQKRVYREMMERSKFVLCPSGEGLSSFRTYEVMAAGRVPVIIADGWLPPQGTAWNDFALFVPESEIENIPLILEQHEPQSDAMSQAARAAFEETYAPTKIFNHLINLCSELIPVKKNSIWYRFPPKLAARALRHKVIKRR